MIQGDPLEHPVEDESDAMDAATVDPVMHVPHADRPKKPADDAENPASVIETDPDTVRDDEEYDADTLETDVQNLLDALADEEFQHDAEWVETSHTVARTDADTPDGENADTTDDHSMATVISDLEDDTAIIISNRPSSLITDHDNSGDDDDTDAPAVQADDAFTDKTITETVLEKSDETKALIDDALSITSGESEGMEPEESDRAEAEARTEDDSSTPHRKDESSASLLGLQAINVLGEKIAASEERYDTALHKMGHALGVIAQRIDSLESRMTSQTIANVALAAAPPVDEDEDDSGVAPYIARAERELKARKESGSMDIFDRIARAAENEFDDHAASTETRVLSNSSDGRRVGTKKWQPSKTVKKRMEQLEKSKAEAAASGNGPVGGRRSARSNPQAAKAEPLSALDEDVMAKADMNAKAAPEPTFEPEEDDDSGLSVVPGARGRRRNRARKSRLDEDFENVFVEDEGQPSIQSLRRKMRNRPADEPEEAAETGKGGMLGNILGKKASRKAAPTLPEDGSEEDDLLSAFEEPQPKTAKTAKKSKPRVAHEVDDFDDEYDDDDDWDDEDDTEGSKRKPIRSILIAAAIAALIAAGAFAWQTFMG